MKKLIIAALLASTTASASSNDAIEVYANVQAASIAAAVACPNVRLTKDFFKEMAFMMEMTGEDEKRGAEIAAAKVGTILDIAKERGEQKWCAAVIPSLVKPIQAGALAPIYVINGGT